jgi:hypothetical protein
MKNPVCEQIQSRNVKGQLRMLQYAQRVNGNVIIMNEEKSVIYAILRGVMP